METVLRVAVVYALVLAGLRILGKREFAQLSPSELVSLLMIPEIVSQALTREDYSLTNAVIGVCTLLFLVFLTSLLTHRFKRVEDVVFGEPTVLVHQGRLLEDAMNETRVSPEEVFSEIRKAGLEKLSEVRWAILEPDGKISIVPTGDTGTVRGTDDDQPL